MLPSSSTVRFEHLASVAFLAPRVVKDWGMNMGHVQIATLNFGPQFSKKQGGRPRLVASMSFEEKLKSSKTHGSLSTLSPPKPWRIPNQFTPNKIPAVHFAPQSHLSRIPKSIYCLAFDSSKTASSGTAPPLVVVGSANADIYVEIDRLPKRAKPWPPKPARRWRGQRANQAVCGGRLQYPTFFVGQIGNDAHGKLIAEGLGGGGVLIDHLSTRGGAPTGHASVALIWLVGRRVLGGEDLEVVKNAGIVLLQREIPDSVNIQVAKPSWYVQAATSARVPVILDAGGVDAPIPPELLKLIDILSPNETELARLTNMPTESFEQISQAVGECHKMGVKQVLVKLGAKGSVLFTQGEEPIRQPIISAPKVIDTTGAGDTFTAAFAVALVEGKSRTECLRFAAAAASLCVQVKGAIPSMPDRKSVLNLLQTATDTTTPIQAIGRVEVQPGLPPGRSKPPVEPLFNKIHSRRGPSRQTRNPNLLLETPAEPRPPEPSPAAAPPHPPPRWCLHPHAAHILCPLPPLRRRPRPTRFEVAPLERPRDAVVVLRPDPARHVDGPVVRTRRAPPPRGGIVRSSAAVPLTGDRVEDEGLGQGREEMVGGGGEEDQTVGDGDGLDRQMRNWMWCVCVRWQAEF
ncbi:F-box/kelch-repeat protein skip25 [Phtheirospermum japonicum]|uniref:Ribokinase n=1 Tax=Phtheirospermum japonicum TaxID=374723 RepID=A0A830D2V3_9LAMI|nr:F-box/kelch-repeat protein skip25 [Phtheirospermum japonicum]